MRRIWHGLLLVLCLEPGLAQAQRLDAEFDRFGNRLGSNLGLGSTKEFSGKRILVWSPCDEVVSNVFPQTNPLWQALVAKGFTVRLETGRFDPAWLRTAHQVWILAGRSPGMDDAGYAAIVAWIKQGKGLYLASDNEPYLADANVLTQRLWGVTISGSYDGQKTVQVRQRDLAGSTPGQGPRAALPTLGDTAPANAGSAEIPVNLPGRAARIQAVQNASHVVESHALLTDIDFLYEGITISHLSPNDKLHTVLVASDGQILAGVSKARGERVVVDCGWTRYYTTYVAETAGTLRYAENIAAYLMGKGSNAEIPEDAAFAAGDVLDRLRFLDQYARSARRPAIRDEIRRLSPTYREVKDKLAEIWELRQSPDAEVQRLVRAQMENAFGRAPVNATLAWLGKADPELAALIWQQLAGRMQRADAARLAGYREAAIEVLRDKDIEPGAKRAALDLLQRLNDRQAVGPVAGLLKDLPRELCPRAGEILRHLTGQDFGPKTGDGTVQIFVAAGKWQKWAEQNAAP